MTQHNREVEEQIKTLVDRYTPVGSARVHLRIKFLDIVSQAQAIGAAKLAEELLGSEEMKELIEIPYEKHEYCLPHEHCYDCERNTKIRSHNQTVTAIKAKVKKLTS